jgi:hypothetical protein
LNVSLDEDRCAIVILNPLASAEIGGDIAMVGKKDSLVVVLTTLLVEQLRLN